MIRYLKSTILGAIGLLGLLSSCVQDKISSEQTSTKETTELSITIAKQDNNLSPTATRANGQTAAVNLDQLQILVFEVLDDNTEIFSYIPQITKKQNNTLTIKAKTSKTNQKFRFIILGNTGIQSLTENTPKQEVLDKYTFTLAGKWNIDATNPIPMWGESAAIVVDRERHIPVLLNLALAKVDIGVNFTTQTQDEQNNEVQGLEHFKLASARVYRTRNKAYVAGSSDGMVNGKIAKPNIPNNVPYNLDNGSSTTDPLEADKGPLFYVTDLSKDPQALDRIVDLIYIPESNLITDNTTMDNTACIVVGGYFGKDNIESAQPKETYYRVDFANYNSDSTIDTYKPILRNHRYVFNIKSVSGPGHPTPDLALNSLPINIGLEVKEWDMLPLNAKVQGEYHFSVTERDVLIPAVNLNDKSELPNLDSEQKEAYENYVWVKVGYDTNIPDKLKPKNMTWATTNGGATSEYFALILEDGYLWFGAKPNAPSPEDISTKSKLEDILTITFMDMKMDIRVEQEPSNLIYNIECESIQVNGKYREDGTLNYTHNIELSIISPTDLYDIGMAEASEPYSLDGEIIHVFSEVRKGISFSYQGTLNESESTLKTVSLRNGDEINVREYKIVLSGQGTPIRDPNDSNQADSPNKDYPMNPIEDLRISTNSILDFNTTEASLNCDARIFFGYKTKKILTIGSNANYRFGYVLEPNTASRAFVDASVNFGIDPNSTVTIDQYGNDYTENTTARNNAFDIRVMSRLDGISSYKIDAAKLRSYLSEFRPDIILVGYATNFEEDVANQLNQYLEDGGVLIMNTEYYPFASSIRLLLDKVLGISTNGSNRHLKQSEFLFTLPEGDAYEEDEILNGPFGDLRGKNWGTDGYSLFRVENLPTEDITVYNRIDNNPCFFKYEGKRKNGKPKAFLFNGDGGFISNPKRYIGPKTQALYDYFPFAIDAAYRPIPRENFLRNDGDVNKYIYNSQLFGNILTWAVDYAETHGYNVGK